MRLCGIKPINPTLIVRNKTPLASADARAHRTSNGVNTTFTQHRIYSGAGLKPKVYHERSRRVFIAMSGGVDSSVAAALLKEVGYDVTGVFIRVWQPDFVECSRTDDRREAMRAAEHLGIPFLTFDFEEEYKREVVDYMIAEYKAGRTPNPDVMCNKQIKFGAFLEKSRAMGADYIATGHYARIEYRMQNVEYRKNKHSLNSIVYILNSARDAQKDQTYFLWTLTQEQLRYVLFPIGDYTKPEVRELARKFELPNAERQDSQGVCFIGEFKMRDFLKNFIPPKRGYVLNEQGEVIGWHDGAFYLTLGQRHGFTITKKNPDTPPLYVVAKDIEENTVTVFPKGEQGRALMWSEATGKDPSLQNGIKEVALTDVNFTSGELPDPSKTYQCRFRYRQQLQEARIMNYESKTMEIRFTESQSAVSPGQSLVIYCQSECLGGGIIA